MRKTWTIKELAKRWGVGRSTAYTIVRREGFPGPAWFLVAPKKWAQDDVIAWEKKAKRGCGR